MKNKKNKTKLLENKRNQRLIASLAFVACILVLLSFTFINKQQETTSSFQECFEKGYLVAESYPRECRTPEGNLFIEDVESTAINYVDISNALANPSQESRKEKIFTADGSFHEVFQENPLQIDFNKSMVVAVFSGQKNTGGYSIIVRRVEETEDSLRIFLTEKSPGADCFVTMAITYPFVAVEIPQTQKTVEFFYDYEDLVC